MNYSSAKFYAISSPNMDTDNIFQFIVNFAHNLTILPQNSKVLTYKLWRISNVFSDAMKYNGANLCANSATNIHTDNIFQFLAIFAQILTILPQNSKVLTFTAWNHS